MFEKRNLSPRQKYLLKHFVNRKDELKRFQDLLDDDEHMVMFVTGENDVGKSTFMARMIEECEKSEWNCAIVACDLLANNDYRTIMRKLRSEIGRNLFAAFENADKEWGQPVFNLALGGGGVQVSVAGGATIKDDAQVGDIAGIKFDVEFPQEHLDEMARDRRSALTDAFISDLSEITVENRTVFFFDAVEKMSSDAERWVMNQLVAAVLDGVVVNVKFVCCGVRKPVIPQDHAWSVDETELKPFAIKDVAEYLQKRGIDGEDQIGFARQLVQLTQGYAGRVANQVDIFEAGREL